MIVSCITSIKPFFRLIYINRNQVNFILENFRFLLPKILINYVDLLISLSFFLTKCLRYLCANEKYIRNLNEFVAPALALAPAPWCAKRQVTVR